MNMCPNLSGNANGKEYTNKIHAQLISVLGTTHFMFINTRLTCVNNILARQTKLCTRLSYEIPETKHFVHKYATVQTVEVDFSGVFKHKHNILFDWSSLNKTNFFLPVETGL
uniref:Uncharacterized protein n=1 Tax=Cacopsylla melanoneura TaxID=428564 RepID=A0A8D8V900_9HEMI